MGTDLGLKKSLGSSPLGSAVSDVSEFNFVGGQNNGNGRSDSIFQDYRSGSNLSLASSFSDKMKKQAEESAEQDSKPDKKIASYYLEIETVKKLKRFAKKTGASYSSIVEQAIRDHLIRSEF